MINIEIEIEHEIQKGWKHIERTRKVEMKDNWKGRI